MGLRRGMSSDFRPLEWSKPIPFPQNAMNLPEPGRIRREKRDLQRAFQRESQWHEVITWVVVWKDKSGRLDGVRLLS